MPKLSTVIKDTILTIRSIIGEYGRRPWHLLYGHGDCTEFLDAELRRPSATFPIFEHNCCDCGLKVGR